MAKYYIIYPYLLPQQVEGANISKSSPPLLPTAIVALKNEIFSSAIHMVTFLIAWLGS